MKTYTKNIKRYFIDKKCAFVNKFKQKILKVINSIYIQDKLRGDKCDR